MLPQAALPHLAAWGREERQAAVATQDAAVPRMRIAGHGRASRARRARLVQRGAKQARVRAATVPLRVKRLPPVERGIDETHQQGQPWIMLLGRIRGDVKLRFQKLAATRAQRRVAVQRLASLRAQRAVERFQREVLEFVAAHVRTPSAAAG